MKSQKLDEAQNLRTMTDHVAHIAYFAAIGSSFSGRFTARSRLTGKPIPCLFNQTFNFSARPTSRLGKPANARLAQGALLRIRRR
jgi:hypothetical protein